MAKTTLVLNVGSSSVKFAVAKDGTITFRGAMSGTSTRTALRGVRAILQKRKIVPNRIIHRIVHGGQTFSRPAKLSSSVLHTLHQLIELAPLHQPANLAGVAFAKRAWPKAQEWGVFDTSLYHDLPKVAHTYALPHALAEKLHIRKYGFHGISHTWAFHQAAKKLRRPAAKFSAVTVHLGSGDSMTLWHTGHPVDTTMGFTPLEGLVMATRSGDIDPSIPLYLQKHLGWSAARVKNLLEQRSGLVGLSGLKDMRDVLGAAGYPVRGWPRRRWTSEQRSNAKLALSIFCYHARRTLAGYLGLMDGIDAIVMSGPIAENRDIQAMIFHDLPAARGIRKITVHADEEQAMVNAVA